MNTATMEAEDRLMERKDVPPHLREAAFILKGVFTRMMSGGRIDRDEEEWEEPEEEDR